MGLKTTVKDMVAAADAEVETVDIETAKGLLGDESVLFVDIRDVRELDREGMIPGALHAPRGMLEFWVDPESPYHKEVFASGKKFVFYCASAWRSALATKALQDMGLEPVAHLGGGFTAWRDAGGEIVERPSKKG
ncbi:MAG: rhodanese-like domain-containing protein [Rhodospirillales bacterium]|nr:rhodanese-like domain-containing protein [Rhodospirillales bacterium]